MTRRHGSAEYQVQRFFVDGREMLYVLTFCLPRFLDQPFDEKLVTVFHELYHVSPAFDGDLRRHPGRYAVHSHSKDRYDSRMAELVDEYVEDHPEPELFGFLPVGLPRVVGHARRHHRRGRAPAEAACRSAGRVRAPRPEARKTGACNGQILFFCIQTLSLPPSDAHLSNCLEIPSFLQSHRVPTGHERS